MLVRIKANSLNFQLSSYLNLKRFISYFNKQVLTSFITIDREMAIILDTEDYPQNGLEHSPNNNCLEDFLH